MAKAAKNGKVAGVAIGIVAVLGDRKSVVWERV